MSDELSVDFELAHEKLNATKERIEEAGSSIPGFNPVGLYYNAELATIRQLLVGMGVCTATSYVNLTNSNLEDSLAEMIDLGIGDPALLNEEDES